ncbi:MAG TPA: hypothetical protein VKC58_15530 [Myxococcales bacterium]|jgi:hypothetical protein|nr:hypothetical protein [Myxococcales bacterium]
MTPHEIETLLRHQKARGPLPSSSEGLSAWITALHHQLPPVSLELQSQWNAISRLRAAGLVVEEADGKAMLRFPPDGDALDRTFALLGLPPIEGGGAAALLSTAERAANAAGCAPAVSLPLRVQAAKACALGWSSELFSLTLLISNVSLREEDGALLGKGGAPVVAVCAEYDRPVTSLDPPGVAGYRLEEARTQGVPMLRVAAGWFRPPLRLEPTAQNARVPAGRSEALGRAERFLDALDEAWQRRIGSVLEVAWPVYRPARAGPLLDAVAGRPLPEMELR